MAAYIYKLDTLVLPPKTIDEFEEVLEKLYSGWDIDPNNIAESPDIVDATFIILLTYWIKKYQIDEAINVLKTIPDDAYFGLFAEALSWCKNIKVFNTLLTVIKSLNVEYEDIANILHYALRNGNFKLAKN